MSKASQLLASLQEEIEKTTDWQEQVRLNSFRQFTVYLVSLTHPQLAIEFMRQTKVESSMPHGIRAISNIFKNTCSDEDKIQAIRNILKQKGYDGTTEKKSWLRTDVSHQTYCKMARAIANYEQETTPALEFYH